MYGRPIQGSCALDTTSVSDPSIEVQVAVERQIAVESTGKYHERNSADGSSRSYQLPLDGTFDLLFREHDTSLVSQLDQPLLYAERGFTGHGQERGGVHTVLTNPSEITTVNIVYLESLPWFMKPYLHTLRATTTSSEAKSTTTSTINAITSLLYRPGIDRKRSSHLELALTIPPLSTVTLTYDFDKAILRYTEYPPDANRGFDVAPAIIRVLPGNNNNTTSGRKDENEKSTYLRTTSLLLPLPTPDFSMPYNVIILTSTVIAMGFGSIFNLLVRRFVAADEVEAGGLAVLKERVRMRLGAVVARLGLIGKVAIPEDAVEREKKVQ